MHGVWTPRSPELSAETRRNLQPFGELHHRLIEHYAPPSVLVNEEGEILHLSESAGRFLRFAGGTPTMNLLKVIHPALLSDVRAALFAARQGGQTIEAKNVRVTLEGVERFVNLTVRPIKMPEAYALLIFEEIAGTPQTMESVQAIVAGDAALETLVRQMENELQAVKDRLRGTIEQYETSMEEHKAANEELQAMNEELRSASEELETGKEELQSVNEELTTVNHELKEKIEETGRINSDLKNLMRSTDIATIFLDRALKIKRYTPKATEIFNLIPADIGRPLEHITHRLSPDDFGTDAAQVLENLKTTEREVFSPNERAYLARFAPYRSVEDRIDGVVLTFIDITERKRTEEVVEADLQDTRILQELAARLVSEENIQTIYDEIMTAAIRLTRSDAGTVQIYDETSKELLLLATSGFKRKITEHFARIDAGSNTSCGIALATGERSFIDFDVPKTQDKDGSLQMHVEAGYLSAQSTPLVSRTGKSIGMVSTHWKKSGHRPTDRELRFLDLLARQAADLIEQRQAEEALRESEAKYRSLFDSIDEGFCIVEMIFDADGKPSDYRFVETNPVFAQQTGLVDAVGKTALELIPDIEPKWIEIYGRVALTGESIRFEDNSAPMNRWFDVYASRVGGNKSRQVAIVFRDITERKRAESNLAFLAEISHDLAGLTNIDDTMNALGAKIAEQFDLSACVFAELFGENEAQIAELTHGWHRADVPSLLGTYQMREFMTLEMIRMCRREESIIIRDVFADPKTDGAQYAKIKVGSFIGVPLVRDGDWRFLLVVYRSEPHDWSADEIALVRELTTRIWTRLERARAEEALRESESRFRALVNQATAGICRAALDGTLLFVNRTFGEILGYADETELLGKSFWDLTVGESEIIEENRELFERLRTVGELFQMEKRLIRKDGSLNWVNVSVSAMLDASGKPHSTVAVVVDITERKRAEEDLRESEARLSGIISQAVTGIAETDLDGRFVSLNDHYLKIVGYTRAELLGGMRMQDITHPEDLPANLEMFRRLIETGEPFEIEKRYLHKNGAEVWVHNGVYALPDDTGKPQSLAAVVLDITARKQAEKRLRRSEEFHSIISANSSDWAFSARIEPDGRAVTDAVTEGFTKQLGYTLEEMMAAGGWETLVHPDDLADAAAQMEKLLAGATIRGEIRHVAKDGKIIVSEYQTSPILDENGRVVRVYGASRDITERKQAEEVLRVSEERYRALVEAASQVVWTMDADGQSDSHRHWFSQITGKPLEEIKGKGYLALIHPEDREPLQKVWREVTQKPQPYEVEFRLQPAGTDYHFYQLRGVPLFNPDGTLREWMGTVKDVTENRLAEQALRQSEARYALATIAVKAVIYDWNITTDEIVRSAELENLLGFAPDEAATQSNHWWKTRLHPDDAQRAVKVVREAIASGAERFQDEYRLQHRDGPYVWVQDTGVFLRDEQGQAFRCVGSVRNITERKQAEEKLRRQTALLNTVNDNTTELIFMKNLQGRLTYCNQATLQVMGLTRDEAIGSEQEGRFHNPSEIELIAAADRQVIATGATVVVEEPYTCADGVPRIFLSTKNPVRDKRGNITGVIGVSLDITERKHAEEILRQKDEILRRITDNSPTLLARCSRDLRYLFVNRTAADWLGRTPEEIIGSPIADIMGQAAFATIRPYIARVLQGERVAYEADIPYETLGRRFMHVVYVPEHDEAGAVIGWFATVTDNTERNRAATALRESEERLRIATEAARMYSWEFDAARGTYKFSANAAAILGVAPERLPRTAEDAYALVYPDDLPTVKHELAQALATGQGFKVEICSVTDTGATVCLNVETVVVKDGDKPARIIGIAQDVTERRAAAEAIRASSERLRIAVEAAQLATWDWDLVTDEVIWNERHFLLFGMEPVNTTVTSAAFTDHVHPADRERVWEQLKHAIATQQTFETEFRALRDDGAVRWMEGYGHVVEQKNGTAVRMSGVMGDITERKRIAEDMRESQERLQLIMDSVEDYVIITTDMQGTITDWNIGAARTFGYEQAEIIGQSVELLFTAVDRAAGVPAQELQTALREGRAEDERFHIRKDGTLFYLSGVMTPLKDGELAGFVKIARDLTEKINSEQVRREKGMLQKLVAAQEDERKRIARDLHDELGQQMTALRLQLEAARKLCENSADAKLSGKIDEIQTIAKQIDNGVDFLAWELRPAALDDLGLYAALEKYVREWSHYSGVTAELLGSTLKKARFAPETETNLYRIAQEALNNTNKHAHARAAEIVLEKRAAMIVLIVSDDGAGFNPADKVNRNQGLGLIGMRERAVLLGGSLEIESAPGQGTTIYVRVPLSLAERSPEASSQDE